MNYQNIIFTLAVSFLITFVAMPVVRTIACKIGAVDVPKDGRRMHKRPIPRLGGMAMVYGFLVSILCFAEMTPQMWGMLAGATIIFILGVVDDVKALGAKLKFAVQIVAAVIVVLSGVSINFLSVPTFISSSGILELPKVVAFFVSVLWILGITNAVNLIDGLDGLAAGVSTIASLSMLIIAVMSANASVAVISAALVGCCLGFLPFNLNPAKMFMGDCGATFLGFVLATMSIQGLFKGYAIISFAVPFLILGLPIFDTSFAILRRIMHRKPIMTADRGHLHHRLIDMGFSQKQTVAILYSISSLLGLCAIIMAASGTVKAVTIIFAVVIFLVIGSYFSTKPEKEADKTEEIQENGERKNENK